MVKNMMNENNEIKETKVGRRSFLKMAALAGAFGSTSAFASSKVTREATAEEVKNPFPGSKRVKTICTSCSVGCGIIAEVHNGVWVRQEPATDHPISKGGHCCKGADMIDMVRSKVRVKHPLKKVNGKWKRISWDTAFKEISETMLKQREKFGPDSTMYLGSAKMGTEQSYYFRKFACFWGTNNTDHQARLCHSSTVAGVANTWGYGAMTNSIGDMQNSKTMLVIGCNPAVNHPVSMQSILKSQERNNAQLIVVDPRFTRTAAKADIFCQIRPGTDIPFVYGMLHLIFKNGWEDKKFIADRVYGMNDIKREAKKWTPEKVSDVTGAPVSLIHKIAKVYATNGVATIMWAMGWTQHTVGSSNTRIGPILQMALGYAGQYGGGCNILRGHDNVQGATDMCCLSHSLPGYYGLSEGSWRYFAKSWGVDYEWLKGRFKSKKLMETAGFTLARWWAGAIGDKPGAEKIYNGGTTIKTLFVQGNGVTSTAQQAKVKEGLDALEMLVIIEPFVNEAAVLTDKKDNVYVLPAATQFETSGSVTATNRAAQWRTRVVKPLYESKTDHEIMFEFAKRFGFHKEYTKGMLMRENKSQFTFPEDATDEIARIIKTIGLTGWTAKRLKKHQENWHMFDEISGAGYGPMKGEFYGLPWPAWTEKHCGSPILYNTNKSIKEGGGTFRNRYGLEHEGVSQLASRGSYSKGSHTKGGYAEITRDNIEKITGIKLTADEKRRIGKNWKVDESNIIAEKCVQAGISPNGNARARAKAWNFIDQIPMHREPIHSPRPDLVKSYPNFKDMKNQYRVDTAFVSKQMEKVWSKDFPIILITGRLVEFMGAGIENRASKYIAELEPEMFCEMHPGLAATIGVKDGAYVWIHSPEGTKVKVRARYDWGLDEDRVFMPYHYAGWFQGEDLSAKYPDGLKPFATGESANTVTNYGYDAVTQIPETKVGLCKIVKA